MICKFHVLLRQTDAHMIIHQTRSLIDGNYRVYYVPNIKKKGLLQIGKSDTDQ